MSLLLQLLWALPPLLLPGLPLPVLPPPVPLKLPTLLT